jgi:hypothetical protein
MNDLVPTDPILHDLCKVDHLELQEQPMTVTPKTMTIADLKRMVVEQNGSLSQQDLADLSKSSPDTLVGIKYGIGGRDLVSAEQAVWTINCRMAEDPDQYVRDVFIPAQECDRLREAFHWPKESYHWHVAA